MKLRLKKGKVKKKKSEIVTLVHPTTGEMVELNPDTQDGMIYDYLRWGFMQISSNGMQVSSNGKSPQ